MYTKSHSVHGSGYECTSGLLSKSGSEGQYYVINKLRCLLVELSREALRDMSIGHNHQAQRLLIVPSQVGKNKSSNVGLV